VPRKTDLIRQIRDLARAHGTTARLIRQGSHEIWECEGFTFPLPRHRQIAEGTARIIIRRLAEHLENLRGEEDRP